MSEQILLAILISVFIIIQAFAMIYHQDKLHNLKKEALDRGYAEYIPDKNGFPKFVWVRGEHHDK